MARGLRLGTLLLVAEILFSFGTSPTLAQTQITADEFLDAAEGRTLTFHDFYEGDLIGVEQFLSRETSIWRGSDGICVFGDVFRHLGQLCFSYDNNPDRPPSCWWTFQEGDRLLVKNARLTSGEIQEVTSITSDPIECTIKPGV